jgi:hypothetical protein
MSDSIPYLMYESGSIPGVPGIFGGGQTIWIDQDTREVVDQMPMLSNQDGSFLLAEEAKEEKVSTPSKKAKDASPVSEKG